MLQASLQGSVLCSAFSQLQDAPRQVLPPCPAHRHVCTQPHQHTGYHWHMPQERPAAGTGYSSGEEG